MACFLYFVERFYGVLGYFDEESEAVEKCIETDGDTPSGPNPLEQRSARAISRRLLLFFRFILLLLFFFFFFFFFLGAVLQIFLIRLQQSPAATAPPPIKKVTKIIIDRW